MAGLGQGLVPVGGDLSFDELALGPALGCWQSFLLVAFSGSFVHRCRRSPAFSSLITASSEGKWPRFIGDSCVAGSSQPRYCWWRGYLPRSGGEMTRLSIGGKSRNGMNLSQARSQVVTVWGYLTPMSDSEKSVRACQAASWFGAVQIGLESGRDLPALPVGDKPHPGARNRVDHTGGDRGLGPRTACVRLGKAGEPVTFPRALRSRAGGAPSTISTSLTPLLASSAHTSRPTRRLPPRAQILKPRA